MKIIRQGIGLIAGIGASVWFFGIAFAQTSQNVTLTDPLGGKTFQGVTTAVAQFLFQDIALPLSVIMVLVGAFQIMTAGGDTEKFTKGRKTITYAAIGLVAAFLALGIVGIVKSLIGQS